MPALVKQTGGKYRGLDPSGSSSVTQLVLVRTNFTIYFSCHILPQCWGSNSGPHVCQACALHPQPVKSTLGPAALRQRRGSFHFIGDKSEVSKLGRLAHNCTAGRDQVRSPGLSNPGPMAQNCPVFLTGHYCLFSSGCLDPYLSLPPPTPIGGQEPAWVQSDL
jgi:hypothetical protein